MAKNLFADPPLLHSWDEGKTWNTGGFTGTDLEWLHNLAQATPDSAIAETGAGCSTLALMLSKPQLLLTVSDDAALNSRIRHTAKDYGVDLDKWICHEGKSEDVLFDLSHAQDAPKFDFALIDGGHGWPTVFLDFFFLNRMMKAGSILILDDVQLYSVGELARFLTRQWDWNWVSTGPSEKTIAVQKMTAAPYFPDWGGQPYIVEESKKQKFGIAHYNLGPRS
jgi:hypothetical protein